MLRIIFAGIAAHRSKESGLLSFGKLIKEKMDLNLKGKGGASTTPLSAAGIMTAVAPRSPIFGGLAAALRICALSVLFRHSPNNRRLLRIGK